MEFNRLHVIFDYSFLYYKYKFQLDSGRMRRLTQPIERNGVTIEADVSQMYYSMREIEQIRRKFEENWKEVVISVVFDSKSDRKNENTAEAAKYKSNRGGKLTDVDFANIADVQRILTAAGYNTFKVEGFEADDIIHHLVTHFSNSDKFDHTVIYTPDADLLINVSPNVSVMRYKSGKGYTWITLENFEDVMSKECKCRMPYNGLYLYKSTVGDRSDCIDGIKGFGPTAFNKLVTHLTDKGFDWKRSPFDNVYTQQAIEGLRGYLTDDQVEQALHSYSLVRPAVMTEPLDEPTSVSTRELREAAYGPWNMVSLIP